MPRLRSTVPALLVGKYRIQEGEPPLNAVYFLGKLFVHLVQRLLSLFGRLQCHAKILQIKFPLRILRPLTTAFVLRQIQ